MSNELVSGSPAGWYDDPRMVNTRRYWDGTNWTDQVSENADTDDDLDWQMFLLEQQQKRSENNIWLIGLILAILLPPVGLVVGLVVMFTHRFMLGLPLACTSLLAGWTWVAIVA